MSLPKEYQGYATVKRVIFNKGAYNILLLDTEIGIISVKDCFGTYAPGKRFYLQAQLDGNEKYPDTYKCIQAGQKDSFEIQDDDIVGFLSTVIGEKTLESITSSMNHKEIKKALDEKNVEKFESVDGIGEKTIQKMFNSYSNYNDYDLAYSKLGDKYNLTYNAVKAIVKHFHGNPVTAITMIDENPYNLTKVKGFGFKRADTAYLYYHDSSREALSSDIRIIAYMEHMFQELAKAGSSYLSSEELIENVMENIPGALATRVINLFNQSNLFDTIVDERGYKRLYYVPIFEKELYVSNKLKEMIERDALPLKNVDNIIKMSEATNGYPFSKEQELAIRGMVHNNVYLVQGYAGTGKTTSVSAFTKILEQNGVNFIQCTISGKAADNLYKVTGYPSRTIASLLVNHEAKDYDCIIIDEISMVDLDSFYRLLNDLQPHARLIMMGDAAQLDAIGIGVMYGMIDSHTVPTIVLDKIHRQAQDSAIITHSMAIRNGNQHQELTIVEDKLRTYGVNKDLSYLFVDSKQENKILNLSLAIYKKLLQQEGIDDVQILCSTKSTGAVSVAKLNSYAQRIANPPIGTRNEVAMETLEGQYILREGDRIVNKLNNRKDTLSSQPIFNGNTGRILSITDNEMVISFDGIGEVEVYPKFWNNIQLGYAMTTHSSQGSTIRNVIVALPFHYMLNSRELLYTAVTRASKRAIIITSPRSYKRALGVTSKKVTKTNLSLLLKEND